MHKRSSRSCKSDRIREQKRCCPRSIQVAPGLQLFKRLLEQPTRPKPAFGIDRNANNQRRGVKMGGSWWKAEVKTKTSNKKLALATNSCTSELSSSQSTLCLIYFSLHPKGQTQDDPWSFNIKMPFLVGCADSSNNDRVVIEDVCMAKLPPRIKENGWTMCQRMRVICTSFAGLAPRHRNFFDGEGGNFSSCQRPDTAK